MKELNTTDGEFDREAHQDFWLPLLSDYTDGLLPANGVARLEAHLAECKDCAADLEGLRQTVSLLHKMPELAAPRSFALTPAQARRLKPSPLYRFSGVAAAIAAVLLLLVFSLDLLGVFAVGSKNNQSLAAVAPTATLPPVGTLLPPDTNNGNGSISSFGGVTLTEVPNPTAIVPANTTLLQATTGTTPSEIHFFEFGLLLVALAMGVTAFAVRPRAPGRLE